MTRGRLLWSDYCVDATHSAAMQRANLVARWITQVGKIELAPGAFTPAGRVLDTLATIGDAGVVESPRLLRAGAREADGTAIGVRAGWPSIGLVMPNTPVFVR
jgi:hypothetical protein